MISVIILGSGNVAFHLFKAFKVANDIEIIQWYNRNLESIEQYKQDVEITDDLDKLLEADIYILAVSDDAIKELSSKLPFSDRFVVHTSGAMSLHQLDKKNDRGIFYPLQTFSKDVELDFSNVPFCLEVETKTNFNLLIELCEAIGSSYYKVNSEQRSALHLAAVFVNNFTNQLYRTAHEITESTSVDFNILKPLIMETARKIQDLSPYRAQTGPALRRDKKTIKKHLKLLQNDHHKEIYNVLTKAIQQTHGKKL